jgi:hypothetical protein
MTTPLSPFKAFEFEANVEAKMLTNSWGFKQDRIHILGYDGEPGKDPYAIASTRMNFTDTDAKLGCIDRHFYVPHKQDKIWYKINI